MSCFDFHSMSKLTIVWVELVIYAANQLDHSCKILTVKNTNTPFSVFLVELLYLLHSISCKSCSDRVLNLQPDDSWKLTGGCSLEVLVWKHWNVVEFVPLFQCNRCFAFSFLCFIFCRMNNCIQKHLIKAFYMWLMWLITSSVFISSDKFNSNVTGRSCIPSLSSDSILHVHQHISYGWRLMQTIHNYFFSCFEYFVILLIRNIIIHLLEKKPQKAMQLRWVLIIEQFYSVCRQPYCLHWKQGQESSSSC